MTKGIAIQTILMLLVGILVVGIIVYMVYRYFVQSPLGEQECRSRAIMWCTGCRNGEWTAGQGTLAGTELETCANKWFSLPGLVDCNGADGWCAAFIPTD